MAPHDLGASGHFRYGTLKLKGLECEVLSYVEWMDRWTVEIPVKDQKGKNLVVARSLQGRRVEVQEPGFDGKNYWFLMEKGRKMLEIIQKDRTRLVVAMDGIN